MEAIVALALFEETPVLEGGPADGRDKGLAVCIGAREPTLLETVALVADPDDDEFPTVGAVTWIGAVADVVRARLGFCPGNVRTGSGAPAWSHAVVISVPYLYH